MIRILGTVFAALAGLAFGSFLNVCVTRWPEGESVVGPRSHCRHCGHVLAWWENVPLLSWLVLRGRCRACRAWIGWRYPLVEVILGSLWAFAFWQFGVPDQLPQPSLVYLLAAIVWIVAKFVFCWMLVALAVLDAEHFWLPNMITIPGTLIGFAATLLYAAVNSIRVFSFYGALAWRSRFLWDITWRRMLAILAATGFLLLTRWLYWLFRRREGLGLGDVKLMALLAAWLGLRDAILALVVAALLGTLAALALLVVPAWRRESAAKWAATPMPFGTFLCMGGIAASLWGSQIVAAYLHWAGF
jgi:leader peptidase (prepilin peptidase)/N-methyltransferase